MAINPRGCPDLRHYADQLSDPNLLAELNGAPLWEWITAWRDPAMKAWPPPPPSQRTITAKYTIGPPLERVE